MSKEADLILKAEGRHLVRYWVVFGKKLEIGCPNRKRVQTGGWDSLKKGGKRKQTTGMEGRE